jgi:hypothetical protein
MKEANLTIERPRSITASDVTRQRRAGISNVPVNSSVGELLEVLLPRMRLNQQGHDGNPIQYQAHLEREARHLHPTERVGDVLQDKDHLVIHPRVTAG